MEVSGDKKKRKLARIFEGWKNLILENEQFKLQFEERAGICSECKRNRLNICTLCACFIPAKVRSTDENCPLYLWKKIEV